MSTVLAAELEFGVPHAERILGTVDRRGSLADLNTLLVGGIPVAELIIGAHFRNVEKSGSGDLGITTALVAANTDAVLPFAGRIGVAGAGAEVLELATLSTSVEAPFAHRIGITGRLVEDESALRRARVGFVVPLAIGITLAATTVSSILVGALSLALGCWPFTLNVASARRLIGVATAFLLAATVLVGPHALGIVFALSLVVVAVEALEQAEITTVSVEFATGVVDANSLGLVSSALHQATIVIGVPNTHAVRGAETLITFIFAASATLGDAAVPHATVVAFACSLVGSGELTLDGATEAADRPRAHLLADAGVGVFESVAGRAAFVGDEIPHAAIVSITSLRIASIRVGRFASRATALGDVGLGRVPSAHGVGSARLFLSGNGVCHTAVGAATSGRLPLTSSVGTAWLGLLVLVLAASCAALADFVEATHGCSQASRLVEERAKSRTGGSVRVPEAVKLSIAGELSHGAVAANESAGTVDNRNRVVGNPGAHGIASTLSAKIVGAVVGSDCELIRIRGLNVLATSGNAQG